jgi:hypothetical protein
MTTPASRSGDAATGLPALGVVTVYDGTRATVVAVEVAAARAAREREPLTVVVVARRVPPYAETIAEASEAAHRQNQDVHRRTREVRARCDTAGLEPHVLLSPRRSRGALAAAARSRPYRIAVAPARPRWWRLFDRVTIARLQRHTPEVVLASRR